MNLLSEIISKPVLNLYSGKIEGTINSVCFDKNYKKITHFKMFDNDEEEYLLETSKIYSIDKTVVIKNSQALTLCINQNMCPENNPINLHIFTTQGESKGKLANIEFNQKFEVEFFITDNNEKIKQNKLLTIGENLIFNTSEKNLKITDFKPKFKVTTQSDNVITILPKENDLQHIVSEPTPPKIENKPQEDKKENFKIYTQPTPQKLVGNGNFLIGRKALKTIYGLNNEIIIKKDNIINAKNLENAKKHSKLIELTVFSKIKA